ncbi:MAG: TlpA disulfide reductase family protein, partial [Bacteroidetes bacterium]|nr:TlpA disulfide reductase family protein [Bacteroidota bacterium]
LSLLLVGCSPKKAEVLEVVTVSELVERVEQPSSSLTVYNFWASWCTPCLKEMPEFEAFAKLNPDARVVFISLDRPAVWETKVPEKINELGIQNEVLLLETPVNMDWRFKISERWELMSIPVTLITLGDQRLFFDAPLNRNALEVAQLRLLKNLE